MRCQLIILVCLLITGCSFNPLSQQNHLTGNPVNTAVGAAVGAGGVSLLGGSKTMMVIGGLTGGAIGYYTSTLTFASGGLTMAGGKVYKVGDIVGIYIPTDQLFDVNTSEFLPTSSAILDSAAAVLARYPHNNILISGNTSGFMRQKRELKLSEKRARKVAAYLWNAGINDFQGTAINTRTLQYVGYGDYFPISHTDTNKGLRKNSRIQITSYPMDCDLQINAKTMAFNNEGSFKDKTPKQDALTNSRCYEAADGKKECFDND